MPNGFDVLVTHLIKNECPSNYEMKEPKNKTKSEYCKYANGSNLKICKATGF